MSFSNEDLVGSNEKMFLINNLINLWYILIIIYKLNIKYIIRECTHILQNKKNLNSQETGSKFEIRPFSCFVNTYFIIYEHGFK